MNYKTLSLFVFERIIPMYMTDALRGQTPHSISLWSPSGYVRFNMIHSSLDPERYLREAGVALGQKFAVVKGVAGSIPTQE